MWDKRILRDAIAGRLPPWLVERGKVPFFHGAGLHHAYEPVLWLLEADDMALVEEAFAGGQAAEVVDTGAVRAAVASLSHEFDPAAGEFLLRLVNMGLLEAMAAGARPPREEPERIELPRAVMLDSDASLEEAMFGAGRRAGRTRRRICPRLAAGVAVLRRTDRAQADESYLVVNGVIEYELDGGEETALVELLNAIDGTRCLGALCETASVDLAAVRDELAAAVGAGLVELRSATPGPPDANL